MAYALLKDSIIDDWGKRNGANLHPEDRGFIFKALNGASHSLPVNPLPVAQMHLDIGLNIVDSS
jgi:hypothetical protein